MEAHKKNLAVRTGQGALRKKSPARGPEKNINSINFINRSSGSKWRFRSLIFGYRRVFTRLVCVGKVPKALKKLD